LTEGGAEDSEDEDGLRRGERKGAFKGVRRRRLGSRSSMMEGRLSRMTHEDRQCYRGANVHAS
jgi:hypothetical protein